MQKNPPATARKRGRPPHAPTAAQRRQVSVAAGGGMTHEAIALALGIDRDTLAKHYAIELSTAANMRRMEVLSALYLAAKKGSSSAARAYLANSPDFEPLPAGGVKPPAEPPAPRAEPMGKKEAADAAAKTVQIGTGWDGLLPSAPLQ